MSWVRVDDSAPHHPKLLSVGPIAAWLWVCGLAYCNRQKRRDGVISDAALPLLYPLRRIQSVANLLCSHGLWERVDGGYAVHDYHEYQLGSTEDTRATRAESGRKGGIASGEARKQKRSKLLQANEANLKQTIEAPSPPIPSHPNQEREESLSLSLPETEAKKGAGHRSDAIRVFNALNAARQRAIARARPLRLTDDALAGILGRLKKGRTVEECLHVIAVYESEVKAGGTSDYFDVVSPWRPDNFERAMAKTPGASGKASVPSNNPSLRDWEGNSWDRK